MIIQNLFLPCEWTVIAALFLFFLIQIVFYLTVYRRLIVLYKQSKKDLISYSPVSHPVSVIVYACNDAENLEKYLPAILNQNYPSFEVIVVNDGSTDETKDLLTLLETKYPHLYQTYIPEEAKNHSRRKLAMTVALKAAKYDWILTTEANCEVPSPDWIASVARNFTDDAEVVLMYSTYAFPASVKSAFRSLDNLFFSIRYLSMATVGRPFMGVRRNLAYRKALFFRNGGGFSGFLNLRDGDDDLFINRIATKENTRVEISPESVTKSHFYQFDKAWKSQKQAYGITSHYLKNNSSFLFGFETFSRLVFYIIAAFSCFLAIDNIKMLVVLALFFLIRFIVQLVVLNKTGKILGEKSFFFSPVVYDWIQPIVDFRYRLAGRFTKRR